MSIATPETDHSVDWDKARRFAKQCIIRQAQSMPELDVEDVTQSLMVKVVRLHQDGRVRGEIERLISGIVGNHVKDEIRAMRRRKRGVLFSLDHSGERTSYDRALNEEVTQWEAVDARSRGEFGEVELRAVVDNVLEGFCDEEREFIESVLSGHAVPSSADTTVSGTRGNRYRRFLEFRRQIQAELSRESGL